MSNAILADFEGLHAGEKIVICGLGRSIVNFGKPSEVTIGVNDIGRYFTPTYLLVCDPHTKFSVERYEYIKRTQADAVFWNTGYGPLYEGCFERGVPYTSKTSANRKNWPTAEIIPHHLDSPYMAFMIALWMGATDIAFIGVDHDGSHPNMGKNALEIITQYKLIGEECEARGIRLVKLSEISQLPYEYQDYATWSLSKLPSREVGA